ncbi:glutathione S-transferase [Pseudomonas putida]|uniref:glutathione S-transferase n=1 Tax=Pseudomonas putida TaxID=303 RepID=UPI002364A639|nr:glutathione S-transferase [Pseudomonas putida]MDD2054053.1 glutathione S-transferase [Pseudomonas putida]
MSTAVLYSFRRCPYAIRARLALRYSGVPVHIEEVSLKAKPARLLELSPKATVPVLACADGQVIEQSLEIMQWALTHNDPDNWQLLDQPDARQAGLRLIAANDTQFKHLLDAYKYPERHPQQSMPAHREAASAFIACLDRRLQEQAGLVAPTLSLADFALLPFVRQFAHVDRDWFAQTPYGHLQAWLARHLESRLFIESMAKVP